MSLDYDNSADFMREQVVKAHLAVREDFLEQVLFVIKQRARLGHSDCRVEYDPQQNPHVENAVKYATNYLSEQRYVVSFSRSNFVLGRTQSHYLNISWK